MPLIALPNELVLQIAESLPSEKDINALTRTNQHFYTLLNPYLYHHSVQHYPGEALVRVSEFGLERAAVKLLAAGADVNALDRYGITPLVIAAGEGQLEFVKFLVRQPGIDLNGEYEPSGFTPLGWALASGKLEVAEFLIGVEGVDLMAKTHSKWRTPLVYAAMLRDGERVVRMLLETQKVTVSVRDMWGLTPLMLAAAMGHTESYKLLLEATKKESADGEGGPNDDGQQPWRPCNSTSGLSMVSQAMKSGPAAMRLLWSLDMETHALRDVFQTDRIPMPYEPQFCAPADIYLRAGNTLLPPRWIPEMQCSRIPTKIQHGTVEIVEETLIADAGHKRLGTSFLLNVLNASTTVYAPDAEEKLASDEPIESSSMIFIRETDILKSIFTAVEKTTSIAQAINYSTKAAARWHSAASATKLSILESERRAQAEKPTEVKEGDHCCDSDHALEQELE